MCSTPRPKRSTANLGVKQSGSILSNINTEARINFANRANKADERRLIKHQEKQLNKQAFASNLNTRDLSDIYTHQSVKTNIGLKRKSWQYWLVSASFTEIVFTLFFTSSK